MRNERPLDGCQGGTDIPRRPSLGYDGCLDKAACLIALMPLFFIPRLGQEVFEKGRNMRLAVRFFAGLRGVREGMGQNLYPFFPIFNKELKSSRRVCKEYAGKGRGFLKKIIPCNHPGFNHEGASILRGRLIFRNQLVVFLKTVYAEKVLQGPVSFFNVRELLLNVHRMLIEFLRQEEK
jgi:hypothetical protein